MTRSALSALRHSAESRPWLGRAALFAAVVLALMLCLPWLDHDGLGVPVVQALWNWWLVLAGIFVVAVVIVLGRAALAAVVVLAATAGGLSVLPAHSAQGCTDFDAAKRIRVLSANTSLGQATGVDDLVRLLKPDVVVLPEADRTFVATLQQQTGDARFEYSVVSELDSPRSTSALSRLPVAQVERLGDAGLESVAFTVRAETGPVRILAAHPFPPLPGQSSKWRHDLGAIKGWVAEQPKSTPLLLAGDFNASAAHPAFRDLRSGLGEAVPARGGFRTTWPQWPAGAGTAPIDHILVRDLCVADSGVSDLRGSDHRAVWADFAPKA